MSSQNRFVTRRNVFNNGAYIIKSASLTSLSFYWNNMKQNFSELLCLGHESIGNYKHVCKSSRRKENDGAANLTTSLNIYTTIPLV